MDKKIKIMHLIWSMGDGGAQRIVLNYLRDFSDDPDIELILYVFDKNNNSYCDNIIKKEKLNVKYLNKPISKIKIPYIRRWVNSRIAQKEWEKVINDYKPDIVHIHISELLLNVLNPVVKCNVPIRFDTLHSNPLRYNGKKLKIIRNAFKNEKFIPICVTQEQAIIAQKHYRCEKFEIVYNGIDIDEIKNKIIGKKEARMQLKVPEEAFVIIGVGRLNKIKRFDLLINAFKVIAQKESKALLIIAGEGNEMDNLRQIVIENQLEDKVRFIGNQENVIPLYCAADMLGVTSVSESASLVLLEAQVCELNCVISDGVPNESIISNKVKKMEKDASIEQWAEALTNTDYTGKKVKNIEEYEVHNLSNKMKQIYIKYWKEYINGIK